MSVLKLVNSPSLRVIRLQLAAKIQLRKIAKNLQTDEFVLHTIQRSVILQQITLKLGSFNNLKAFFP